MLAVAVTLAVAPGGSAADGRAPSAGAWGDRSLPAAATLQGYAVHTRDADELRSVVMGRLLQAFGTKLGITVSDAERDAHIRAVAATLRAQGIASTGTESEEDRRAREQVATIFVRHWKTQRALLQRDGGRVIFQQAGPEPLDALRRLAESAQARGELVFHDAALEAGFWRYFRDDRRHSFYTPAEAARVFDRPPWAETR